LHALEHGRDDSEFFRGHQVDEVVSDVLDVGRDGAFQATQADVGEFGEDAASVVLARDAADQVGLFHAADLMGQPAAGGQDAVGEVAHPQGPVGGLGQQHQDAVFRQGETAGADEFAVKLLHQPLVAVQIGSPAPLFGGGEPTRLACTTARYLKHQPIIP